MNLKKIILSTLLSSMLANFVLPGGYSAIRVSAISNEEISAMTERYKVDGYDLTRVLKKDDKWILQYTHQKNGAQVVFIPGYENQMNTMFRIPAENNKGTNHVLEHCLIPMLYNYRCVNGHTDSYGLYVTLREQENSEFDILNPAFDEVMDQLSDPAFLKDRTIFDRESHFKYKDDQGNEHEGGRVLDEEQIMKECDKTIESKADFVYGGIPSEIRKLTYEEVCDTYNRYAHPSNSLTCIEYSDNLDNYESVLKKLDEKYFGKFEKKNIEVDFNLANEIPDYICNVDNDGSENQEFDATVSFDLTDFSDKDLDIFRVLFKNCEYQNFEGYSNIFANVDYSCHKPKLVLNFSGQDFNLFTKECLTEAANKIIKMRQALDEEYHSYNDIQLYKSCWMRDRMMISFSFNGDPFSEKHFTINDNELACVDLDYVRSNKDRILNSLSHGRIKVRSSNEYRREHDSKTIKFNLSKQISGNDSIDKFVLDVIKHYILRENLTKKGVCYAEPTFDLENKCFSTGSKIAYDYEKYFFENNFQDLVNNFNVTPEIFEEYKNLVETYKLSFSDEDRESIKKLSREELEGYIRNVRFESTTEENDSNGMIRIVN